MNKEQYILNFFDKSKPCPNSIINCNELRVKYFTALESITNMPNCKDCNVSELKSYFINKFIKIKKPKILFDENVFKNTVKNNKQNNEPCESYLFVSPFILHITHCKKCLIFDSLKYKTPFKYIVKNKFFIRKKNDDIFILFYDEKNKIHKISANIKTLKFKITRFSIFK